jgi:serine/threonine protein kinase
MEGTPPEQAYHLHPGTVLSGRYIVGTVLGFGGFGVTYKAWDSKLSTIVAIKEFYPNGLVSRVPGDTKIVVFSGEKREHFDKSLQRFLEEARNMAKFNGDPHIVNVFNFFEENSTAYIVMEFLDGTSLKQFLAQSGGKLEAQTALEVMSPIMDALARIHDQGIIHRDISPDNIFITVDNKYKLLDFGAARFSTGDEEKTVSVVIKVGYAAPEQYRSKSKQGNYTDIYSIGATLYHLITGVKPEESVDRQIEDTLKKPSELGISIGSNLEKSIMKAMAIKPELRFQKIAEFKDAVYNDRTVDYPEVELKKRKKRRIITTSAICAGFAALCVAAGVYFSVIAPQARLSADALTADAITVWLPAGGYGNYPGEQIYKELAEEFTSQKANSKFKVDIVLVPEDEYSLRIAEAAKNQSLPTLFMPDKTTETNAVSLKKMISSLNKSEYIMLNQYEAAYPDLNRMPIGFLPVVAYENTVVSEELKSEPSNIFNVIPNGNGKRSYYLGHYRYADLAYITGPSMISGGKIVPSQKTNETISKIKTDYVEQGYDFQYTGGEMIANYTLAYFVEDTAAFREVQNAVGGVYNVSPFEVNGKMIGSFKDGWSVSKDAAENQQEIAMLFLSYLLSDSAQNKLHIQNDNAVPMNGQTFLNYLTVNTEFAFLKNSLPKFTLIGQYREELTDFNEYVIKNIIVADIPETEIKNVVNGYKGD